MKSRLSNYWRLAFSGSAIALAGLLLTGCSDDVNGDDNIPFTPIELEPMEVQVTTDLPDFSISLFKETYRYNLNVDNQKWGNLPEDYDPLNPTPSKQLLHRTNTLVSPLSASMTVGMMVNALEPADQTELMSALGFNNSSVQALNSLTQKLIGSLPVADNKTKLNMINGAWVNNDLTPSTDYTNTLNSFYSAPIKSLALCTPEGKDEINAWLKDKSGGQFTDIVDRNDNTAYTAIWLNVLSFNGEWKYQFDPSSTERENFTSATNMKSKVMMMKSKKIEVETSYYPEGFLSVRLPYGNGAYSLTAIRAYYDDKTIDELVSEFDAYVWKEIQSKMSPQELCVWMPKWKYEATNNILDIMSHRIPEKFISNSGGRCSWPGLMCDNSQITSLFQKIMMETDEEGSRVEVVTQGSSGDLMAAPVGAFYLDRPFIYVISEQSTGAIVAMGTVMDLTSL